MRAFLFALLASSHVFCAQVTDPFLVSAKVQTDLDSALSRLIPPEQFLVQVSTDISQRMEKRLIEGETVTPAPAEPEPPRAPPMPGFVIETEDRVKPVQPPTKQAFRMHEIPELKAVRVAITFDDVLPELTTSRAKTIARMYLQNNYHGIGMLSFSTMPMLKPVKEPVRDVASEKDEKKKDKEPEKAPLSEVDILWNYTRWAAVALLVVIAVMLLASRGRPAQTAHAPTYPDRDYQRPNQRPARPAMREVFENPDEDSDGDTQHVAPNKKPKKPEPTEIPDRRKKVLDRFLARSQAFRQYFGTLSTEASAELYACLKGQAFNKLLEGLAISQPKSDKRPSNIDEILEQHDTSFDEFVHAKDWEDRQFFGFLHSLTDEQLASLTAGQTPEIACVLLRMMQPKQSAAVLSMISGPKRAEILAQVKQLAGISFSDLVAIERDIRAAAQRLPDRYFGSEKEDVTFWGSVVSESTEQDSIVDELVRSRPEIAGQLKKFRFRLEEAASLSDAFLEKVLSQVDNEELCLALATCAREVREVIIEALPDLRRQVISEMLPSYKNAHKDRTMGARLKLTRRIREAMG